MTALSAAPASNPRSRKLYVLWATALTLLISTALFCWLVVVPVWRTRSAVHTAMEEGYAGPPGWELTVKAAGGPAKTAELWRRYRRLPDFMAPYKRDPGFIWTLSVCGEHAMPQLLVLLDDADADTRLTALQIMDSMRSMGTDVRQAVGPVARQLGDPNRDVREWALRVLHGLGPSASGSAPEVIRALADADPEVRTWAAGVLCRIPVEPKKAIPALKEALGDEDVTVRKYAAEAIKKIKAAQGTRVAWGKVVNGLRAGLAPLPRGEVFPKAVHIHNTTTKPLPLNGGIRWARGWYLRYSAASGRVFLASPLLKPKPPPHFRPLVIAAGEKRLLELSYKDVESGWRFQDACKPKQHGEMSAALPPGKYTLTATCELGRHPRREACPYWHGKLTTGAVEIEVMPKAKVKKQR